MKTFAALKNVRCKLRSTSDSQTNGLSAPIKRQFSAAKLQFNGAARWPNIVFNYAARPRLSPTRYRSCLADGVPPPHPLPDQSAREPSVSSCR